MASDTLLVYGLGDCLLACLRACLLACLLTCLLVDLGACLGAWMCLDVLVDRDTVCDAVVGRILWQVSHENTQLLSQELGVTILEVCFCVLWRGCRVCVGCCVRHALAMCAVCGGLLHLRSPFDQASSTKVHTQWDVVFSFSGLRPKRLECAKVVRTVNQVCTGCGVVGDLSWLVVRWSRCV